ARVRRAARLLGALRRLPRGAPPARSRGSRRARLAELLRPLPPGAERPRPAHPPRRGAPPHRRAAAGRSGRRLLQRRHPLRRPPHRRRACDRRPPAPRAGQTPRRCSEKMSARRQLRELEQKSRRDPQNLAVRLQLAAALRSVGRREEATVLVRSVALAYHAEGRLARAPGFAGSSLEREPAALTTQALFAELESARTGGPGEEPTQFSDGKGRRPTLPPMASPLPVVDANPEDYEIEEETAQPASG